MSQRIPVVDSNIVYFERNKEQPKQTINFINFH